MASDSIETRKDGNTEPMSDIKMYTKTQIKELIINNLAEYIHYKEYINPTSAQRKARTFYDKHLNT